MPALMIDTKIGGSQHDLTHPAVADALVAAARQPTCRGVFASGPCSAWSVARFDQSIPHPPPILHDCDHPAGVPLADGSLPAATVRAHLVTDAILRVLRAAHERALPIVVESPPSRGAGSAHAMKGREKHVPLWSYPPMADFIA